jgi:FlaA1/EpsC-like NDP-sugar epimerase
MKARFAPFRSVLIGLVHGTIVCFSLVSAFLIRFDFTIPHSFGRTIYYGVLLALPTKSAVFYFGRLDRPIWRFADARDLWRIFIANTIASAAFIGSSFVAPRFVAPRSIYLADFLICSLFIAAVRFAPQLYTDAFVKTSFKADGKGILIYGAGVAGTMLVRELRNSPSLGYSLIGFLDDDLSKRDLTLMGVPVLGTGRDAAQVVRRHARNQCKIEEIVIAIPSANDRQLQEVLANCKAAGIPYKTIPSHGALLSGGIRNSSRQDFSVEDLLGRESVQLNEDRIRGHVAGRCVLVTGAAGSVGSELCRQIARFNPEKLIAFDQAESEVFKLDLELRKNFPSLVLLPEIGDVRDPNRIRNLMMRESVMLVIHAAAYKHVPLMEANVLEAAKNNILGTWNVAQAARDCGVADFLMISTDKAVRPTSVMGATKRVAEMITSLIPPHGATWKTKFVSVRFGNVLGSNGSVVPIFQAQIAAGGPVTVTHPDACRYFMTTREAVQLILQASTMGQGADIFVLDMGEPVRIVDLARNMIRLSGFVPDRDIEICYTGLRPGEKIFEELISEGEDIAPTYHEKIKIFKGPRVSSAKVEDWIDRLRILIQQCDEPAIVAHMRELAVEYRPAMQWYTSDASRGVASPAFMNLRLGDPSPAAMNSGDVRAGLGSRLPDAVEGIS